MFVEQSPASSFECPGFYFQLLLYLYVFDQVTVLLQVSESLCDKWGEYIKKKKKQQSHSHCREVQSVSRKVTPSTQGWLTWHPPGLCSALG